MVLLVVDKVTKCNFPVGLIYGINVLILYFVDLKVEQVQELTRE